MPEVSNGGAPGRVTTGVAGLDDAMSGGLPPDRLYLVEGEPGSGKTTDSRELRLGPGIQVGVSLRQFHGVLSGVPTILQDEGVGQDGARA